MVKEHRTEPRAQEPFKQLPDDDSDRFDVFPWNDNFVTGIALVDDQHRHLVHLINKLANHLARGIRAVEIRQVFEELANYAEVHFRDEESVWGPAFGNDAWLANHQKAHESFLPKVLALQQENASLPYEQSLEIILKFLVEWLIHHILDSDRRMSIAVLALRRGMQLDEAKQHADLEMSGLMQTFVATVLGMYGQLTERSLRLNRALQENLRSAEEINAQKVRIQSANKELNAVFHSANDGIALVRDWKIVRCNSRLDDLLGFRAGAQAGESLRLWFRDEKDYQEAITSVGEALLETGKFVGERQLARIDGGSIWARISASAISGDRRKGGVVLVVNDITAEYAARQSATLQNAEREQAYAAIVAQTPESIVVTDAQTRRFVEFNEAAHRNLGYTREEFSKLHIEDIDDAIANADLGAALKQMLRPEGAVVETRHKHKDGSIRDVRVSARPIMLHGRVHLMSILTDITDAKATQRRITRLANLYATLSLVNEAVVKCTSEEELYAEVCRAAVEAGGSKFAWIGVTDSQSGAVRPVAWYGPHPEYLDELCVSANADDPYGKGLTGTCIREDRCCWTEDYETDQKLAIWRSLTDKYSFRSAAAMPIHRDGACIGAINLYQEDRNWFDEELRQLLMKLSVTVSYALDAFRQREQRRRAEELSHALTEQMAFYFRTSPVISYSLAVEPAGMRTLWVSENILPELGYTTSEASRPDWWSGNLHPDDRERVHAEMSDWLGAPSTEIFRHEYRFLDKAGKTVWILDEVRQAIDDSGSRLIVGAWMNVSERKKHEAEQQAKDELLWRQGNYDALTGLPNRRLFMETLARELNESRDAREQLALFYIDLDHFKEINDVLGYEKGDILLQETTRRIGGCLEKADVLARVGGDGFAIVLRSSGRKVSFESTAQRILETLSARFGFGDGNIGYTSASIGIALFPDDGDDVETLVHHAEQAMFMAKKEGRGRFNYFIATLQDEVREKRNLTNDLRLALNRGELQVHYQPIFNWKTGQITKAEALLRWNHPTLGMISPARFIPLAEESRLIIDIGEWVFQEVIATVERWLRKFGRIVQVSVNMSPVQFEDSENFLWLDRLRRARLPPLSITVEITEGLLVRDSEKVRRQLKAFQTRGVEVSIDDFGTGFSALSYLKLFDVDYLKIDKSFVTNLADDPNDRALTEAIVVMAHRLGMKAIAEGVETTSQRDMLAGFGCDYFQGYLFSPAVPSNEFERLIQAGTAATSGNPS